MVYTSEILIAIVDTKPRLKALAEKIQCVLNPAEQAFFAKFRWVHMEKNSWAYVFHHLSAIWHIDTRNTWRVIAKNAKTFKSSYIFYRIGEDDRDTEIEEHTANGAKDYRYLLEMAYFQRKLVLDKRVQSVFEAQYYTS